LQAIAVRCLDLTTDLSLSLSPPESRLSLSLSKSFDIFSDPFRLSLNPVDCRLFPRLLMLPPRLLLADEKEDDLRAPKDSDATATKFGDEGDLDLKI